MLKHGAAVLACCAQQGLKLGRVLVPPQIKSCVALHRAHTPVVIETEDV